MFSRAYKIIAGMLVIMLFTSIGLTSVQAKTINSKKEDSEVVQIQFANIYSFGNNFEISDSGKSTFTSTLTARNVDEVSISCDLQQYSAGKWKTIKSWSGEYSGMGYILSKSWYVASGYSYRLKSYAYVYKDGSMIESDSHTSSNIYY
jgi:hypothetical protein